MTAAEAPKTMHAPRRRFFGPVLILAILVATPLFAQEAEASTMTIVAEETRDGNAWYAHRFHVTPGERFGFSLLFGGHTPVVAGFWLLQASNMRGMVYGAAYLDSGSWEGTRIEVLGSEVVADVRHAHIGTYTLLYLDLPSATNSEYILVVSIAGEPMGWSRMRAYATEGITLLASTSGSSAESANERGFDAFFGARTTGIPQVSFDANYVRSAHRDFTPDDRLFAVFAAVGAPDYVAMSMTAGNTRYSGSTIYGRFAETNPWRFSIDEFRDIRIASNRPAGHVLLIVADVKMP